MKNYMAKTYIIKRTGISIIKFITAFFLVLFIVSCGPKPDGTYKISVEWNSPVESDRITKATDRKSKTNAAQNQSYRSPSKDILSNQIDDASCNAKSTTKEPLFTCKFDQIMVKLKDHRTVTTRSGNIKEKFSKMGKVRYKATNPIPELITVKPDQTKSKMTEQDWVEMIDYYNSLPEVEYAFPDYIRYPYSVPNDPGYSSQWNMQQLNMPDVWDITDGNRKVKVAIIDSGFANDLDDSPVNVTGGYDFADDDDNVYPPKGVADHGTHVAGTIAEATNNKIGVVGMAPNVTIMPLKVFSDTGGSNTSYIIQAIEYAIDNGADIINMSLGSRGGEGYGSKTDPFRKACTKAFKAGIAIFSATGNDAEGYDLNGDGVVDEDYDGTVGYPAGYDHVMAVGATGYHRQRAPYSQYGTGEGLPLNYGLDIMAPGGEQSEDGVKGILQQTTASGDSEGAKYYSVTGTSMACPHVSALGALMLSVDRSLKPQEIYDIIEETADRNIPGYNETEYGHGLINPLRAVLRVVGDGYPASYSVEGTIVEQGEQYWYIKFCGEQEVTINLYLYHEQNMFELHLYEPDSAKEVKPTEKDIFIGDYTYEIKESGKYRIKVKRLG